MRKILRGHVIIIRFLFTLCLGFTFLVEANAQVSGTYTINSGSATGGTNFQTFADAIAYISGGINGNVVFNVAAGSGPYNEQIIIDYIPGTSPTSTIVFNGNGTTLTYRSYDYDERACVKLNDADHITFDNFTVTPQGNANGQFGYGFHLLNNADANIIRNCRINLQLHYPTQLRFQGVVINGSSGDALEEGYSNCDSNLIEGNTITGGGIGITLASVPPYGSPADYISNNKVINNHISNFSTCGIQTCYTTDTKVDRNELIGGMTVYFTSGIVADFFNDNLEITNNRIHDFYIDGSFFDSEFMGIQYSSVAAAGKPCTIANNLIYEISSPSSIMGIACHKLMAEPYESVNVNVYNNTISLDDQMQEGYVTYGVYFEHVKDVKLMNNIVTVSRNATDLTYGVILGNDVERFTADRNVYYITGSGQDVGIGEIRTDPKTTIAEWRQATGQDYFSQSINPGYANLAGFDLRPTVQAIDNMARYVGITTDITNAARNTNSPDIGCYEFNSAACSAAINAGFAVVAPDSILCLGPAVSLGLQGNSAGSGQTYRWQTSATATGTFTDVTGVIGYPFYETTPTTTQYYRVGITCDASTVYSSPVRILVTTAMNAGTYTINSAQPTSGINFASFSDAAKSLQCGLNGSVVFNVAPGSGPYNEQVIMPELNTSAARTVTFNCNGVTMAYTPTNPTNSAVFKMTGTDYITIDSLNIEVNSANGFGFGIQMLNDADHNTVKRCTIKMSTSVTTHPHAGIVINNLDADPAETISDVESFCDSNTVINNKVYGGSYGISVSADVGRANSNRSTGHIVKGNTLVDNASFGIWMAGITNTLIDSNDIYHANRTSFPAQPFVGINMHYDNFGFTISNNKIHDLLIKAKTAVVQLDGISFERTPAPANNPNTVVNNSIYNFFGNGLQQGLYAVISTNIRFLYNTVSLEDTTSSSTAITRGFALFGSGNFTGLESRNNNIVVRRGGTGDKYCFYMGSQDNAMVMDYNNYYLYTTAGFNNHIAFRYDQPYTTLANWQATGRDAHAVSIDPVFYDLAGGDLTPTKIAFENLGTPVTGITKDILHATRNTTRPDIGAYEFTVCSPLSNPVISVDSAGVRALQFRWAAIPNTTGYRVSTDGVKWVIPSSGAMGTTHVVAGLNPRDKVELTVKALGTRADCPEYLSAKVEGQTESDGVYVPNMFTPNGDGRNDEFKIYSNITRSVRWMVFNQWGQKVFETTDKNGSWDGTFGGKPQPIGVYVYVLSGVLADGSPVTQKGSFNLIR